MADSRRSDDWTEAELAYLAGILDGEGHVGMRVRRQTQTGNAYFEYTVRVGNTDDRLVLWLKERFGGGHSVDLRAHRLNGKHKPLHLWVIGGKKGEPLLRAVLPYLKLKSRQAELVLQLRDSIRLGNNQFSEVRWAERERMLVEMQKINRRGRE